MKSNLGKEDLKIVIPEGNKNHLFLKNEIIYIQSDKYYVYIHTEIKKKLVRITLKKLESILNKDYVRINKSIIINTQFVSQIEYHKTSSRILLTNGIEFFASKTYNDNLRSVL